MTTLRQQQTELQNVLYHALIFTFMLKVLLYCTCIYCTHPFIIIIRVSTTTTLYMYQWLFALKIFYCCWSRCSLLYLIGNCKELVLNSLLKYNQRGRAQSVWNGIHSGTIIIFQQNHCSVFCQILLLRWTWNENKMSLFSKQAGKNKKEKEASNQQ